MGISTLDEYVCDRCKASWVIANKRRQQLPRLHAIVEVEVTESNRSGTLSTTKPVTSSWLCQRCVGDLVRFMSNEPTVLPLSEDTDREEFLYQERRKASHMGLHFPKNPDCPVHDATATGNRNLRHCVCDPPRTSMSDEKYNEMRGKFG